MLFHSVIEQGGVFLMGDTTVVRGAEPKALWSLSVDQGGGVLKACSGHFV